MIFQPVLLSTILIVKINLTPDTYTVYNLAGNLSQAANIGFEAMARCLVTLRIVLEFYMRY